MRLWRWLKKDPEVVYVPVFGDNLPYSQKWMDDGYLKAVAAMGINTVWATEIIEAVTVLRNKADTATSTKALKAYNDAIKVVKDLLIKPELAKYARNAIGDDSTHNERSMSSLK